MSLCRKWCRKVGRIVRIVFFACVSFITISPLAGVILSHFGSRATPNTQHGPQSSLRGRTLSHTMAICLCFSLMTIFDQGLGPTGRCACYNCSLRANDSRFCSLSRGNLVHLFHPSLANLPFSQCLIEVRALCAVHNQR